LLHAYVIYLRSRLFVCRHCQNRYRATVFR